MNVQRPKHATATAARLCVLQVHVAPAQVWFHCPRCDEALEGFFCDPRGTAEVVCDACGTEFDIPHHASLILNEATP